MSFKAIIAKPPNLNQFTAQLLVDIRKAGEPAKQDFTKTTQTWNHKPGFQIVTTQKGNSIELFVGVESDWKPGQKATANDIWRFVTRGTSERHALMSPDFSPKTRKRVIGSSGGRGHVVAINKGIKLPGIEGREFEQVVTKNRKGKLKTDIEKSFGLSAVKVNWKL